MFASNILRARVKKVIVLVALLGLAFGLEAVTLSEEGRLIVELTALGVLLAFAVACYLWWKLLAALTKIVLVLLAVFGFVLLLNRWGVLGGMT